MPLDQFKSNRHRLAPWKRKSIPIHISQGDVLQDPSFAPPQSYLCIGMLLLVNTAAVERFLWNIPKLEAPSNENSSEIEKHPLSHHTKPGRRRCEVPDFDLPPILELPRIQTPSIESLLEHFGPFPELGTEQRDALLEVGPRNRKERMRIANMQRPKQAPKPASDSQRIAAKFGFGKRLRRSPSEVMSASQKKSGAVPYHPSIFKKLSITKPDVRIPPWREVLNPFG
jgi:hypothetical protein